MHHFARDLHAALQASLTTDGDYEFTGRGQDRSCRITGRLSLLVLSLPSLET